MKILALDIGAGTEDILLYDSEKKRIENCVKLVLPSPTRIFAQKVKEATRLHRPLFIKGSIIGGGAFSRALKNHLEQAYQVVMTEEAAYTIRNNLEQVKKQGISIIPTDEEPKNFRGLALRTEEVNLKILNGFLKKFNEDLSNIDFVAIAVQDHGVCPKNISNRRFRLQKMRQTLTSEPKLENLAYKEDEIPSVFLRLQSAAKASKRQLPNAEVVVMDTAPAAILGCLSDPKVQEANSILVVNLGNGHTMAATLRQQKVTSLMEHHTQMLNPNTIEKLLVDFINKRLVDQEIFNDGGHGVNYLAKTEKPAQIELVVATGPNRRLLANTNLPVHFAAPAGDVMMTGPIGLVEATKKRCKLAKTGYKTQY